MKYVPIWLFTVVAIGTVPIAATAAPNFTRSSISVSPESPSEGDVVGFVIVLRNSDSAPAEAVQLTIDGPAMGYLIDVAGLASPTVDVDARRITAAVTMPAEGELPIRVRTLAPRTSAGLALGISLHVAHYASSTEVWEHKVVEVGPRPVTTGVRMGPTRLTPAGLSVVVWLASSLIFYWLIRVLSRTQVRKSVASNKPRTSRLPRAEGSPLGTVAALMIPVGFWLMFGAMAWRDYRTLTAWKQSPATIIGRRTIVESGDPLSSSGAKRRRSQSADESTTYTPEYALRYVADGVEILSTGYDTGSSLRLGGRVLREQELRDWTVGTAISCWYDPDDPHDVVVRRGFGGAYWFALFPVPVFWYGLNRLRRAFGRHDFPSAA